MEIEFGPGTVETELKDVEVVDLANNPSNTLFIKFLEERIAESFRELRGYISTGQIVQAQIEEGKMEALEAVVDVLAQGFAESIKADK